MELTCARTREPLGACSAGGWRETLKEFMLSETIGNISTGFVVFNLAIMCMPYAQEPQAWTDLTNLLGDIVTWIFIVEMVRGLG